MLARQTCSHNGCTQLDEDALGRPRRCRSPARSQAAALVIDGCHQGGYLTGILVINHSAAPAPRRHARIRSTGLLDRLRPADLGGPDRPAAAPGRIDEEPSARQLDGNSFRRTARGSCRRPRTSLDRGEPGLRLGAQIELMAPPSTGIIAPVI